MATNKIFRAGWRMRKAYSTAATVLLSYGYLYLLKRVRGQRWYQKRMSALHVQNAIRVKTAILELQCLFIKMGQLLSILGNFLPDQFKKPLEELQDQVPPRPYEEVRARILKEFGKEPEALFQSFEQQPLASASIGQVHKAILPDGRAVAVKVQYTGIEEISKVDLEIIRRITRIIAWFFDISGMDNLYAQLRKMIEEELDFTREAASMQHIGENLKKQTGFVVPEPIPAFSTSRVLTTTWQEGVKITQYNQLEIWKTDRRQLAERLLKAYCQMLFEDGYYHADPHPGNIMVKEDGTVVLLDFGAVATLSSAFRENIVKLVEAVLKNDLPGILEAAKGMGFVAEGREAKKMAEKMVTALRNFLQNEVKIENLNFKDIEVDPFNNSLFDLIRDIGFSGISSTVQVPKEYVLLNRTLTLLLGLCNELAPGLNPLDVVQPYLKTFVLGKDKTSVGFVTDLVRRTGVNLLALPDALLQTLTLIRQGDLEVATPDIRDGARLLYQVGQQFVFTMLILGSAGFGYLLLQNKPGWSHWWGFGPTLYFIYLFLRSLRIGGKIRRRLE